jgi:hypothetical protein
MVQFNHWDGLLTSVWAPNKGNLVSAAEEEVAIHTREPTLLSISIVIERIAKTHLLQDLTSVPPILGLNELSWRLEIELLSYTHLRVRSKRTKSTLISFSAKACRASSTCVPRIRSLNPNKRFSCIPTMLSGRPREPTVSYTPTHLRSRMRTSVK